MWQNEVTKWHDNYLHDVINKHSFTGKAQLRAEKN